MQTYLDSVFALREMHLSLRDLLQNSRLVLLGETSADSAGLLWSEVEWEVLLVLIEKAELSALVGVDYCEDLGDRLADIVAKINMSVFCAPDAIHDVLIAFVSRSVWGERSHAHLGELGGGSTRNLLGAELTKLSLELSELLLEVLLVLAPERAGLNFCGRLTHHSISPSSPSWSNSIGMAFFSYHYEDMS
jgi:hypothetical protein